MAGGESGASDAAIQGIPVVVALEAHAEPAPPLPWYGRIALPRIVDYLIVAAFMFFWL